MTNRATFHALNDRIGGGDGLCIALTAEATADKLGRIQLFPEGRFEGRGMQWVMDAATGERLVREYAARKTPLPVDFEHSTLHAGTNGARSPAAGWIKRLQWVGGKGLYAFVEWVGDTRELITSGQYRYVSPFFEADGERITRMHPPALTNYPAIDGMEAVAASNDAKNTAPTGATLGAPMEALLAALRAAFGLPDDATEQQMLDALGQMKKPEAVAMSATPDPAKYVPIAAMVALQEQVSTLSQAVASRAVDETVSAALSAGKLLPGMEAWARDLGAKNLVALQEYLAVAPVALALSATPQTATVKVGDKSHALSAAELMVCEQLGLTPEQFAAQREAV